MNDIIGIQQLQFKFKSTQNCAGGIKQISNQSNSLCTKLGEGAILATKFQKNIITDMHLK